METDDQQLDDAEFPHLLDAVLAGRYRVAQVVSAGASTVLVDAIDLQNDGQVTLKIVRPELAQTEGFRHKFERLAEVSKALSHPNIASVSDWGELQLEGSSTVYWVVDALGGGSLRDLLDRGRLLEPGQALVIGLEACRALDAAHQKGLFHTELSPSKMVFGVDRRLRIVDFGMARLLAEPTWADAATVPTHIARYCSPEQALGLPIDSKTDVYALALVLIEAVTGSVPFDADSTVATLAGRVDKLLPVSADLGALAAVLERAGRPESPDRFTAAEFGRALVQAAPKLPKPEPIPIISSGTFDTTAMRRPHDPTGGIERPAPVALLDSLDDEVDPTTTPAIEEAAIEEAAIDEAAIEEAAIDELGVAVVDPEEPDSNLDEATVDDVGGEPTEVLPVPDDAAADTSAVGNELLGERDGDAVDAGIAAAPDVEPSALTEDLDGVDLDEVVSDDAVDDDAVDDDAVDDDSHEPVILATEEMPVAEIDKAVIAGEPTLDMAVTNLDAVADEPPNPSSSTEAAGALFDDEAKKRRRGPTIALLAVLIAGLAALGYAGWLLMQPKSVEIPVLAGVSESSALNQILDNEWTIVTERERSDSFPVVDTVIRTVPGPGVDLEEGESFTLVLSDGPEFRSLPDVSDLPFEAAVARLNEFGLAGVEATEPAFSEDADVGTVISWFVVGNADLEPGDDILPGETIEMVLSAGPEPRSVPQLASRTIEEATTTLADLRLTLEAGEELFSDDVPAGQIIDQDPAAGEPLERDGVVTVSVSKGPDVVVFPNLDGLSYADARLLLEETGFTIGSLLGTTAGTFVEASVEDANIEPEAVFPRGQAVDLVFL